MTWLPLGLGKPTAILFLRRIVLFRQKDNSAEFGLIVRFVGSLYIKPSHNTRRIYTIFVHMSVQQSIIIWIVSNMCNVKIAERLSINARGSLNGFARLSVNMNGKKVELVCWIQNIVELCLNAITVGESTRWRDINHRTVDIISVVLNVAEAGILKFGLNKTSGDNRAVYALPE